jgi:hypothetical protein
MENKKQLIIIPPMSEPLKKLNEVLEAVANDENIEISIIDDQKELAQFLGSSSQCLLAFANPKKCATFLQDNKLIIARNHSKVILLTPEEIPAKTLMKFSKIGLTESILETAPPKTLLYKVKLLLRSIKTASPQQDERDQIVKSKIDLNQSTDSNEELSEDKIKTEEESVNYMAEERAKFKKSQKENALDYGENLKGKTSNQEEALETHWKSKRKTDDNLLDENEDDLESGNTDMSLQPCVLYILLLAINVIFCLVL